MKWDEFIVMGDPLILGAQISILLTSIAVVAGLTYFKSGNGSGQTGLRLSTIRSLESCISLLPFLCCSAGSRCALDARPADIARFRVSEFAALQ